MEWQNEIPKILSVHFCWLKYVKKLNKNFETDMY